MRSPPDRFARFEQFKQTMTGLAKERWVLEQELLRGELLNALIWTMEAREKSRLRHKWESYIGLPRWQLEEHDPNEGRYANQARTSLYMDFQANMSQIFKFWKQPVFLMVSVEVSRIRSKLEKLDRKIDRTTKSFLRRQLMAEASRVTGTTSGPDKPQSKNKIKSKSKK